MAESLDTLLAGGVRGQRVFVRADLNVPLRRAASETTRASARRCRPCGGFSRRARA